MATDGHPDTHTAEVEVCGYCDEPVDWPVVVFPVVTQTGTQTYRLHVECDTRRTVGSIGHQLTLCSCFGGDFDEPAWLTKREAALVAAALARTLPLDRFEREAFRAQWGERRG